jgi:hypothetical protein
MLTYYQLHQRSKQFQSFVGLSVEQFDKYHKAISTDYAEYERKRLDRPDRQRAVGAGRHFRLSLQDQMMMTLIWLRLYLTYPLLGYLFGLDQSNVYRNIRMMMPLLKAHLPLPERLQPQGKRVGDIFQLQQLYPDLIAMVDATEQPVRRPKGWENQKSYYSGKRKQHTRKTQLTIDAKGIIQHLTPSVPGRTHDYQLFKNTGGEAHLPPEVVLYADKGYQGIKRDYPSRAVHIPKKATKYHPLIEADRQANKALSSIRVLVEHVISRVKKFRVLSDCYRHAHDFYDECFATAAGLVNLRTLDRLEIVCRP